MNYALGYLGATTREQRRSAAAARKSAALARRTARQSEAQQRRQERVDTRIAHQAERRKIQSDIKAARIAKRLANGKTALVDPKESATIDKINAQLERAKIKNKLLRNKLSAIRSKPPRRRVLRGNERMSGMSGRRLYSGSERLFSALNGLADDNFNAYSGSEDSSDQGSAQVDSGGAGTTATASDVAANVQAQASAVAEAKRQLQMEKVCKNPSSMKCMILTLSQQSQQQMQMMMMLMQQIMEQNAALEEQILALLQQGYGQDSQDGLHSDGADGPRYYSGAGAEVGGPSYQVPQGYPGDGGGGFQPAPAEAFDAYGSGEIRSDSGMVPASATPDNAGPYDMDGGLQPVGVDVAASFNDSSETSDDATSALQATGYGFPMQYSGADAGDSQDYAPSDEAVGDLSGLFGESKDGY